VARVVASARLPAPVSQILGPSIAYLEPPEELSRADLLSALADAEGLISLLTVKVDRELFDAAPKLKVVANFAVGYDNVDVAEASRRGIVVCNTPDVLTEATADLTWALILAAARRLVEGDALVRSGRWTGWFPDQHLGLPVHGQTMGIIGLGRIGAAVARRARGFGMEVLYTGPRPSGWAGEVGADYVSAQDLFRRSHVISIHCPLTADNHHFVDASAMAQMRRDAIVVNTARGALVDESALVDALDRGALAAAGLDVFEGEPAVNPRLLGCSKVVLAPHIGSATTTARRAMGETCARAVRDVLRGEQPKTAVNPEVWS